MILENTRVDCCPLCLGFRLPFLQTKQDANSLLALMKSAVDCDSARISISPFSSSLSLSLVHPNAIISLFLASISCCNLHHANTIWKSFAKKRHYHEEEQCNAHVEIINPSSISNMLSISLLLLIIKVFTPPSSSTIICR